MQVLGIPQQTETLLSKSRVPTARAKALASSTRPCQAQSTTPISNRARTYSLLLRQIPQKAAAFSQPLRLMQTSVANLMSTPYLTSSLIRQLWTQPQPKEKRLRKKPRLKRRQRQPRNPTRILARRHKEALNAARAYILRQAARGRSTTSNPNCSNMKGTTTLSVSEAQSRGYTPCSKCY